MKITLCVSKTFYPIYTVINQDYGVTLYLDFDTEQIRVLTSTGLSESAREIFDFAEIECMPELKYVFNLKNDVISDSILFQKVKGEFINKFPERFL